MTENRPQNATYNATRGTNPHNENPRVDGDFVGTTDEIIQWAACKWGVDEDWVRAQIVTESFWDQRTVGDTAAGDGCTSHGLGQVRRCYHDAAFEDENAVRSSAYNLDYTYSVWRACYNGELTWLNTVERGRDYAAGDLQGCMGVWFSGRWHTAAAEQYISVVTNHFNSRTWAQSSFPPAVPRTAPPTTTTTTPTTTTTIAPTTTTQPPVGPSGANITTDVPAGYRQVINENFDIAATNKAAFDSIYPARNIKRYPDNYPDTRTKQGKADGGYYNAPIDVQGGVLNIRMDVVNGKGRVAAIVPLAQPGNGLWGDNAGFIIEERTRFTYTDGFKSAHLTWPASNDSTPDGEIDFAEFDARNNVGVFIHHQGSTTGSDQKFFDLGVKPYEWHTYRMEWVMGQRVRIWVDGVLKVDYTTRIPATPMHIVLQNETWLSSSPVPSNATGLVETDWIRVLVPS